jgi:paraquat-inducible protein A
MPRCSPVDSIGSWRQRWIGYASIAIAVLFPIVLVVPILSTRIPFLSYNEIVLARLAYDLFRADKVLFVIVIVFGMIIPMCKSILSCIFWHFLRSASMIRYFDALALLGKFSMLDVMLLSVFVVAFKGLGVGRVEIKYGLYIYVFFVVTSFFVSFAMTQAVAALRKDACWRNASERS